MYPIAHVLLAAGGDAHARRRDRHGAAPRAARGTPTGRSSTWRRLSEDSARATRPQLAGRLRLGSEACGSASLAGTAGSRGRRLSQLTATTSDAHAYTLAGRRCALRLPALPGLTATVPARGLHARRSSTGTKGTLRLHRPAHAPPRLTLSRGVARGGHRGARVRHGRHGAPHPPPRASPTLLLTLKRNPTPGDTRRQDVPLPGQRGLHLRGARGARGAARGLEPPEWTHERASPRRCAWQPCPGCGVGTLTWPSPCVHPQPRHAGDRRPAARRRGRG